MSQVCNFCGSKPRKSHLALSKENNRSVISAWTVEIVLDYSNMLNVNPMNATMYAIDKNLLDE